MDLKSSIQNTHKFDIYGDLFPTGPDRYYQLEKLGIAPGTVDLYRSELSYSIKRRIPVFLYRNIDGEVNMVQYFSETFSREYRTGNGASYFAEPPTLPTRLISHVVLCPDPLELLSYRQIKGETGDRCCLLTIHRKTHITEFNEIVSRFPNAKFSTIHCNRTPYDHIRHLSMDLTIGRVGHTISFANGEVIVKLRHKIYRQDLSDFSRSFLDTVKQHIRFKVKHLPPPRPYKSYNEVLNRTNG